MAALDLVGCLPGPCSPKNKAAVDVLHGQVCAFGTQSSVAVVDVQQMVLVCTLLGAHGLDAVSAVKWCPECNSRDFKNPYSLRLASGDESGKVAVWDVHSGQILHTLEETGEEIKQGKVLDLGWVSNRPMKLAILIHPGQFIIWDTKAGTVLWNKELYNGEVFQSLSVSPMNTRQCCVLGEQGAMMLLNIEDATAGVIKEKFFRLKSSGGKDGQMNMKCAFSVASQLLFMVFPRELLVFDLDYGRPLTSSPVPQGQPQIQDILAICGQGVTHGTGDEGGIDTLFCYHIDGSVSMWMRQGATLKYAMLERQPLQPQRSKGPDTGIIAIKGDLWFDKDRLLPPPTSSPTPPPRLESPTLIQHNSVHSAESLPGLRLEPITSEHSTVQLQTGSIRQYDSVPNSTLSHSFNRQTIQLHSFSRREGSVISDDSESIISTSTSVIHPLPSFKRDRDTETSQIWQSLMLLVVGSKGQLQRFDIPNPLESLQGMEASGMLSCVPSEVWSMDVMGTLVEVNEQGVRRRGGKQGQGGGGEEDEEEEKDCVGMIALGTQQGTIEVLTVHRGMINPLQATSACSLDAHGGNPVINVQWLCGTARLLSHSVTKQPSQENKNITEYINRLVITDVFTGRTVPFRQNGVETSLISLKVSPMGQYLLVAQSEPRFEIWALHKNDPPEYLKMFDFMLAAIGWSGPNDVLQKSHYPPQWNKLDRSKSLTIEEPVAERLIIARKPDGLIAVLEVKGRRVYKVAASRPTAVVLGGEAVLAAAVAGFENTVFVGDSQGTLYRWDIKSGDVSSLHSGQHDIRRLRLGPAVSPQLQLISSSRQMIGRISVQFGDGSFTVFELDEQYRFRQGPATSNIGPAFGQIAQVAWLPLPGKIGGGSVLVAACRKGAVYFVDVTQTIQQRPHPPQRMMALKHVLGHPWPFRQGLLQPQRSIGSCLLFPLRQSLLMRVLLQVGVSVTSLKAITKCYNDDEVQEIEEEIKQCFPSGAWPEERTRHFSTDLPLVSLDADISKISSTPLLSKTSSILSSQMIQDRLAQGGLDSIDTSLKRTHSEDFLSSPIVAKETAFTGDKPLLTPKSGPVRSFLSKTESAAEGLSKQSVIRGWKKGSSGKPTHKTGKLSTIDSEVIVSPIPSLENDLKTSSQSVPKLAELELELSRRLETKFFQESVERGLAQWGAQNKQSGYVTQTGWFSTLILTLSQLRAHGQLLHVSEWAMYSWAVSQNDPVKKMMAAAYLSGDTKEIRFWQNLPATLRLLRKLKDAASVAEKEHEKMMEESDNKATQGAGKQGKESRIFSLAPLFWFINQQEEQDNNQLQGEGQVMEEVLESPYEDNTKLWDPALLCSFAQSMIYWHELMDRESPLESQEDHQRRMLEYVALGDFTTAVGFLLASRPDQSVQYYRDALCTLALAAASDQVDGFRGNPSASKSRPLPNLYTQAAKVVSVNAGNAGDNLLGVPLLCSAGLYSQAVTILQDARMWEQAGTLIAKLLNPREGAVALERWADHLVRTQGQIWSALGLLVTGGCLRSALNLMKAEGMLDCAYTFVEACRAEKLLVDEEVSGVVSGFAEQQVEEGGVEKSVWEPVSGDHRGQRIYDLFGKISGRFLSFEGRGGGQKGELQGEDVNAVVNEFRQYVYDLLLRL